MGQLFVAIVNIFRNFQVALTAFRTSVVVRMSNSLQFILVNQFVGGAAECFDDLVVFARKDQR